MCSRTRCSRCDKPSWRGCGAHIEQVLGDVPEQERCQCRSANTSAASAQPMSMDELFAALARGENMRRRG